MMTNKPALRQAQGPKTNINPRSLSLSKGRQNRTNENQQINYPYSSYRFVLYRHLVRPPIGLPAQAAGLFPHRPARKSLYQSRHHRKIQFRVSAICPRHPRSVFAQRKELGQHRNAAVQRFHPLDTQAHQRQLR